MRRYDSTNNRAISPQAKVANHATDTVMIKATNRKAIALLLVLAVSMPVFLLAVRDHRPDPASLPFFPVQQLACLPVDEMHPSAGFADNRFVFVIWRIFTASQPVLDLHQGCWAGEK